MVGRRREPVQGVQYGCGNEQRNYFAPVTQNLFSEGFERLRDVCFDPAPLARDLDLARFTGREWLIRQINAFIADRPRGYVIIQAEAGVGKSTLAAHLVGTRPWPCHFTRLPGGRSPEAARKSLAAQRMPGGTCRSGRRRGCCPPRRPGRTGSAGCWRRRRVSATSRSPFTRTVSRSWSWWTG